MKRPSFKKGAPFGKGGEGRKYRGDPTLALTRRDVGIKIDSFGGVAVLPDPLYVGKGDLVRWTSNKPFVLTWDGIVPEANGLRTHVAFENELQLVLSRNMHGTQKKTFNYTIRLDGLGVDPTIIWDPKRPPYR